jgi:hypothetical protein
VPHAIPSRPFTRSLGSLDAFVAQTEMPHLNNEAAPGTEVAVRGWIADTGKKRVDAAWLDISGHAVPVELTRNRPDAARTLGMDDREGKGTGFEGLIVLPDDLSPGLHEARVIGRAGSGRGVYGQDFQRVRVCFPQRAPLQLAPANSKSEFTIRVSDTQSAPHTLGRGAYTVRQESSLRVSGFVEAARELHVVARPQAGDSKAWQFPCDADGRYDATLWTGGLERGLYELTIGVPESDVRARAIGRCWIDIAGPHYLPPLHLMALRTPPMASVMHFGDAGPQDSEDPSEGLVAGHPIGIAGWCLDPVAVAPPLAVYVELDGQRPIPLSHHLLDPRPGKDPSAVRCGFGGIVDTTRFEPGAHRLRVLAVAVSGTGWYVIDDRRFALADHRSKAGALA